MAKQKWKRHTIYLFSQIGQIAKAKAAARSTEPSKLHSRSYVWSFYLFELNFYRMVELCIPDNSFGGKMTSRD